MAAQILDFDDDVRRAARRACELIPGLGSVDDLTVHALEGGITNRNYRLVGGARDVVLRLHGKDTELLGIDRRLEHVAATQAAALGIGPGVAGLIEPDLFLMTEFVKADNADLTDPGVLDAAASLIRRWHDSPAIPGVFDTFGLAETYAHTASGRGVVLPTGVHDAIAISHQVAAVFASFDDAAVPCHNDLLGANFLSSTSEARRLWLIDWEYAGMNTRWFDLGNFSVNNGLDRTMDEALLASYFGAVSAPLLARLTLARVMSDVREAMWGVVQQGVSTLDFDYAAYAGQHFDRMMTNATSQNFAEALRIAGES